jgi:hypothetical protein
MPLLKYYRDQKLSSQGTYGRDHTHSQGNRLGFLKSKTHTNVTANDPSPEWIDRDSLDNSSQKQILGLKDVNGRKNSKVITTTTEVHVEVSKVTDEDKERLRKAGSKW